MTNKIYYISNLDNSVHNINDVEHELAGDNVAYIGKDCGEDGFRVDEDVCLWTFEEIIEFTKAINIK